MNTPRTLWTVPECCAYLHVCKSHFYSLLKTDKDFPVPIRFGSNIRFVAADFDKYVDSKRAG